jgi:nicotinamidase-related amidase
MLRQSALALAVAVAALATAPLAAQTVIDEWASIKTPPPPALKPVKVEPRTTALLVMDFVKQTCNAERRPRCVASLPMVQKLIADARAKGVTLIYTLGPGGKPEDYLPGFAPAAGEPIVQSGVDKFIGTDLEKRIKDGGIATVIAVGTAAHGAVLYTASAAAVRGIKVIVPVDGMSADAYAEQVTAWLLANAPVVAGNVTLTRIDMIAY